MRILSWNIERPKINDARKSEIINLINSFNADLIFLTETNSDISFENYYCLKTNEQSHEYKNVKYKLGENKATIFSKYNIVEEIKTYDNYSSVSGKIETEFGEIILYCSIIGFLGGFGDYFKNDLIRQKEDLTRICKKNNICFSGDLNIAFYGRAYPSKIVKAEMMDFFKSKDLTITTESNNDCAIHIVLSNEIIVNRKVKTRMIEIEKCLSDHNLVITEIE